jgi:hypothetical protein
MEGLQAETNLIAMVYTVAKGSKTTMINQQNKMVKKCQLATTPM